ncbi:flagellar FlbD family protein [Paenibacillus polymyxa]|uniref:flagellar FlbD family protein n=1 Tax=Paenibacillus polymyxa TaxID=1406 RepID=UPI002024D6DD|nr:flagellar FlbD family protein [Paenibacillus polymyxa]MDQ0048061.1 flagellar protein FlbD [Paenibacillus polymyxa]URJ62189.1 flagellar FlbD family protein [Paenibacillus polymyxa]
MIPLTRLNGSPMWLNALLIETVEETPDTYVTLVTGKRLIVLEKAADVVSLIKGYSCEIGMHAATIKVQQMEEDE